MEDTPEISGPFQQPDIKAGSSKKTNVFGYEKQELVLKRKKDGEENVFSSADAARQYIRQKEEERRRISEILSSLGSTREIIVPSLAVIHNTPGGEITYSEAQSWIKDAKPLSSLGTKVLSLSVDSLEDLKHIFQANLKLWKEEKMSLDIVGSTASKLSLPNKLLRHIFPLFYCENIMIDAQGRPQFVDVGRFDRKYEQSWKDHWRPRIQQFGSRVSIALIDLALLFKKEEIAKKILPDPAQKPI